MVNWDIFAGPYSFFSNKKKFGVLSAHHDDCLRSQFNGWIVFYCFKLIFLSTLEAWLSSIRPAKIITFIDSKAKTKMRPRQRTKPGNKRDKDPKKAKTNFKLWTRPWPNKYLEKAKTRQKARPRPRKTSFKNKTDIRKKTKTNTSKRLRAENNQDENKVKFKKRPDPYRGKS